MSAGVGARRLLDEAERIAAIKDRATPPEAMAAAPVAPARGAMELCEEWGVVPGSQARFRMIAIYWRGTDALSVMCRRAAIAHERRGGGASAFDPPFTPGQIAAGRRYRDLVERHEAGGQRCASLETGRGGSGGGGGEFIDAYIHEGREIDGLRRLIGTGASMAVRRIRPSVRGTRASIRDIAVVDMVCLQGFSLGDVLARHGWAVKGEHREALRAALCGALDRMQGYRGVRHTK